jgi:uncharacterized protein YegP (UPF0339 family)
MKARFELTRRDNGKFMFNLKAANQEIILTSQLYATKRNAEEGIASVIQNAALDDRYEEKVGSDGKPYFVLHAANKLVVGRSEMYTSHAAMLKGIASVKRNAPTAETVDISALAVV